METLSHKFVDAIPEHLEYGMLYISGSRRTAIHLCVCGCGNEVVTPISPTDWQLKFDGETVSLSPSIGLWEFKCRSHYWIIKSQIRWSGSWSDQQVKNGREREKRLRDQFYKTEPDVEPEKIIAPQKMDMPIERTGWFTTLLVFLRIK
jgi:hypothetical protein